MNLTKWLLTAGCAVALGVPHAWPQPPAPAKPTPPDVSKVLVVEKPTSRLVADSAPVAPPPPAPALPADPSKRKRVEPAVARVVAGTGSAITPTEAANVNNPTVEPGKVKWHKTVADAQAAAKKSGRPVLVFHMMGQLDKQFC